MCATILIPIVCVWRQLWFSIKPFGLHSILNWICLLKSWQCALPQIIIKCNTQRNEIGIRTRKPNGACILQSTNHLLIMYSTWKINYLKVFSLYVYVCTHFHSFQFGRNALWRGNSVRSASFALCTLVANRNRFAMEFNRDKLHDLLL